MLDICVSDVPTGIMLSSGVDSNTILAALLRNGIRPTVYSFHVKDHYSTDYRYADNLAKKLKLDFDNTGSIQPDLILFSNTTETVGFYGEPTAIYGTAKYGSKLKKVFEAQTVE